MPTFALTLTLLLASLARADAWLAQLTALYRRRLPAGGTVLDLMSSHVSHLPTDLPLARVDGHGMNEQAHRTNPNPNPNPSPSPAR